VTFSVNGTVVGTASLASGVATLNYVVPSGASRLVAASYAGDSDYQTSSGSITRNDPTITPTITSSVPKTSYGWYRTSVTVSFTCTPDGAPLTAACPSPVTFTNNGAGQSVTRSIAATDGGAATVTVSGINIDTVPPTVSISGPKSGAVYVGTAPAAKCVASDALSGVASCTVVTSAPSKQNKVTVTATATDKAGNVRHTSLTYTLVRL
jgi:hypothetical protein